MFVDVCKLAEIAYVAQTYRSGGRQANYVVVRIHLAAGSVAWTGHRVGPRPGGRDSGLKSCRLT